MRFSTPIIIGSFVVCFLISACASNSSDTKTNQATSKLPVAAVTSLKPAGPYHVKRVNVAFPDGMVSGVVSYDYDNRGRLIREDQLNGNGIVAYSRSFTYKPDGVVEIVTTDAGGETKGKTVQFFTNDYLVKEQALNAKGDEQSLSEYQYDSNGNRLRWTVTVKDAGKTITEYSYTAGANTLISIKDSTGTLLKKFVRQFDTDGRLLSEDETDAKGLLLAKTTYEYKGGALAKEEVQNAFGETQRSIKYTANELNLQTKVEYFNRRGQLLEVKSQDWIKIVPVDR